jgi:hypothetical protein
MKKVSLRAVIGFGLFFGGIGTLLAMNYGGDLMRDIAIRGEAMEVHPTARVRNADCTRYYCTRYYLVMSACKIEYETRAPGQPRADIQQLQSTSFMVFGSLAGERIVLLHPRGRPTVITSSANIAYVGNRIAALITLLGTCLVISIGILARYLRENRVAEVESEDFSGSGRALDEAMTRRLQAQGLTSAPVLPRTPTVTGGPSTGGTFGRRGG